MGKKKPTGTGGPSLSSGNDKGNVTAKVTEKIDYDLVKAYIRDIESKTGLKVHKKQIDKLKDALRVNIYEKMTPIETIKHRRKFNSVKNKLIKEWEENTGQTWQDTLRIFMIKMVD